MNGAKEIVHVRGKTKKFAVAEMLYTPTSKPAIKKVRPLDDPSDREMRRRRDLVYLLMKRDLGLTSDEIARTLKFAARSPSTIRERTILAERYYGGRQACG